MFYVLDKSCIVPDLESQPSGRSLIFPAQAHLDETNVKQLQNVKVYGGGA